MEGTTTIMSVLEPVGAVFTAAVGWVGDVADTIMAQPILLCFAVIPLIGLGVSLFKRLIAVN